jgi:hypothetical protein
MNNISTCLAQQTPPKQISTTESKDAIPASAPPPRAVLVDQAKQWAEKALARAAEIRGEDRDEECDVGCAVATHNIGEFLEMEGRIAEARMKYNEASSLAKKAGFKDGVANAKEGLKRLKELEKKR